jgi:hypothetical protein
MSCTWKGGRPGKAATAVSCKAGVPHALRSVPLLRYRGVIVVLIDMAALLDSAQGFYSLQGCLLADAGQPREALLRTRPPPREATRRLQPPAHSSSLFYPPSPISPRVCSKRPAGGGVPWQLWATRLCQPAAAQRSARCIAPAKRARDPVKQAAQSPERTCFTHMRRHADADVDATNK